MFVPGATRQPQFFLIIRGANFFQSNSFSSAAILILNTYYFRFSSIPPCFRYFFASRWQIRLTHACAYVFDASPIHRLYIRQASLTTATSIAVRSIRLWSKFSNCVFENVAEMMCSMSINPSNYYFAFNTIRVILKN